MQFVITQLNLTQNKKKAQAKQKVPFTKITRRCHINKDRPSTDGSLQYSPGYLKLKVQYKSQSIRCIKPVCGGISIVTERESPA